MSESNITESQKRFIAALDYMMAADPRNSNKHIKVREWFSQEFQTHGRASRVSEAKQAYNRVPEQFKHRDQNVIFVVDGEGTAQVIETQVKAKQYTGLETCLVITGDGSTYKPLVLLSSADTNITRYYKTIFPAIRCETLNATINPRRESIDLNDLESMHEFFCDDSIDSGLQVSLDLGMRVICSLLSKRFLIFTGLAGSGKTKIAQAFAQWLSPSMSDSTLINPYYIVVPVGADWTGSENIIGYPNGLDVTAYVTSRTLDLILHARDNLNIPHFIILDEMNLSHVERYFADILSAIESESPIPLYQGVDRVANGKGIPNEIAIPSNLFIIGTVNVDETTYMFSPKVLDRANVIEFRMAVTDLSLFLDAPKAIELNRLNSKGINFSDNFVLASRDKKRNVPDSVKLIFKEELILLFNILQEAHTEFGYRTSFEAGRFAHFYKEIGGYDDADLNWIEEAMDAVIVQKLLPKLHGSRTKLEGLLWALAYACGAERGAMSSEEFLEKCKKAGKAEDEKTYSPESVAKALEEKGIAARYPLSFEKVLRMYRKLIRDQFVTFAEA